MQNPTDLDTLFANARMAPLPEPDLGSGFESRLLAKLRQRRERETRFAKLLWSRAIPVFAAIVLGLLLFESFAPSSDALFQQDPFASAISPALLITLNTP